MSQKKKRKKTKTKRKNTKENNKKNISKQLITKKREYILVCFSDEKNLKIFQGNIEESKIVSIDISDESVMFVNFGL